MKTKIYQNISVLAIAVYLILQLCSQQSNAQSVLYSQSFNAAYPNWPAGWTSSSLNGWLMDTSVANASYTPTSGKYGYPDASAGAMVDISNPSNGDTGTFSVTSSAVSTKGYDNITVVYGARRTKHFSDSGSVIKSFAWTSDGGATWNPITYTENPNDSYWHLVNDSVPMSLPVGAAGKDSIRFRWTAFLHSNAGSGTYRFDDLIVAGTATTGINTLNSGSSINLFPNPASDFAIVNNTNGKKYTVNLIDVTGKILKTSYISNEMNRVDVSDITPGFYIAQLIASDSNTQTQLIKLAIIR